MGCNTSNRVIAEEPPSENSHHDRNAQKQAKETASLETISMISQDGSRNEDGSCQRNVPEDGNEKFLSTKKENNEHNTGIKAGLPKKPVSLLEKERQPSSNILEELRIQGIIKNQSVTSKNRTGDDSMLVHAGRPLQNSPIKLEKLEIKKKKGQ